MAKFEIVMPKLGESIIEATITKWLKNPGDTIQEEDAICELATDKVDSEIPSPVDGVIKEILFEEGDVVPVGQVIAYIEMEGEEEEEETTAPVAETVQQEAAPLTEAAPVAVEAASDYESDRFYSPLVKNIAKQENIGLQELDQVKGSGLNNRLTKDDLMNYLQNRSQAPVTPAPAPTAPKAAAVPAQHQAPPVVANPGDEIQEMDRMRQLIADHMVMSKQVSPHVTMFIDVDMTPIVQWRNKVKADFKKREGQNITFTPIFIQAAARALKKFPMVNASVDGKNIIQRKNVNIGMATALPSGNLIVPVIKDVDEKSLLGITKNVNDLAVRARDNKLQPDEIQGGTFTVTNFGSFQSTTGTPIINQPQVAIMGVGAIKKKPVVLESPEGDSIGIRHMMVLSLAFDHRIVDGAMGGQFLLYLKQELEAWNPDTQI